jgi:hypothetical protein
MFTFASFAEGGLRQFDLPELTGSTVDTLRTVSFSYQGPPGTVLGGSMSVTGVIDFMGKLSCPDYPPPDTVNWPMGVSAVVRTPDYGAWDGRTPILTEEFEPFEESFELETSRTEPSVIREGDEVRVEFIMRPTGYVGSCAPATEPTTAYLVRVTVTLHVSYWIPVENTTWGRVKALYRTPN